MENLDINKLPPQARIELVDFYEFLLQKYTPVEKAVSNNKNVLKTKTQPHINELAIKLFGSTHGIDLVLPKNSPHLPLDFKF